jgi:hypothetical protein
LRDAIGGFHSDLFTAYYPPFRLRLLFTILNQTSQSQLDNVYKSAVTSFAWSPRSCGPYAAAISLISL